MKNTWYCSVCDFYVFNSKLQCKKCLTKKPVVYNVSYDPKFDEMICNYFRCSELERKTECKRCINEGRLFNKDPMLSVHNCWKYS